MRRNNVFIPVIAIILIVAMFAVLTSCGNQAILDPGTFNYNHIHISDNVEGHCLNIEKWWDNANGIEVRTTSGEGIYCSEGTYQIFESADTCPYCHK